MANGVPMQRPTLTAMAAIAALLISIGGFVWNAAILSNRVAVNHERIVGLEKEISAERERRDARTRQIATMEAQLDLLLNGKDKK